MPSKVAFTIRMVSTVAITVLSMNASSRQLLALPLRRALSRITSKLETSAMISGRQSTSPSPTHPGFTWS
ncbi:hypothetical protein IG631_08170 [Alternaria alternata]|nr:hypothetical protein IG631_08170 [Alternaria alternata]